MLYALKIIIIMGQFASSCINMTQYRAPWLDAVHARLNTAQCYASGINMAQSCASGINVGVHHASIWLDAGASTAQRCASGITIVQCRHQNGIYGSMMCIRHQYGFYAVHQASQYAAQTCA